MKHKLTLLAFVLLACLSVQSCREMGIHPWDKDKGGSTNTSVSIDKLVGTKWQLVSIEQDGTNNTMYVPQGKQITLNFEPLDGFESLTQASGIIICNAYGASVKSDKVGEVKFGVGPITEVLCSPKDIADEYTKILQTAQTYKTTDKELRITYSPGQFGFGITKTLVFTSVSGS